MGDAAGGDCGADMQEVPLTARMELVGYICFQSACLKNGMRSAMRHVLVVGGQTVLKLLQQAIHEQSSVAVAESTAIKLLNLHADFKNGRSRLMVFEGVIAASNRACKQGAHGELWASASRAVELLHTLIAVFAIKYQLVV